MDYRLRALPATDVGAVLRAIDDPGGFAALPSQLPHEILLCLVRDLEMFETDLANGESKVHIEGAACLAVHHWKVVHIFHGYQDIPDVVNAQTLLVLMGVLKYTLQHEIKWRNCPPHDEDDADHLLIWAMNDLAASLHEVRH